VNELGRVIISEDCYVMNLDVKRPKFKTKKTVHASQIITRVTS
jgi:hypothetical protein